MSISESSLRPGGDLFNALVGSSWKPCAFPQIYYHPLFVGKRFTLAPFANKLLVETISTVNLKLLQFDFQYLRRGGILYEAALRAGRQCEWGPLASGRLYYIWAVPSSPTQFSKAFALREQMSGTTAFHFSTEADCLVIADETESMQTSVPTEGEDQQCMQGSQDLQNNVIRPSSAAELRALRLAKLGVPPPAPLSPRDTCLHKLSRSFEILSSKGLEKIEWELNN